MSAVPKPSSWAADMQSFQDEAAGVLVLQVVQRSDMPDLLLDVVCGSSEAQQLLGLVSKTLTRIETAPRGKSMLCGCCPKPIRLGGQFSLVVAWPGVATPERGLVLAICHRCGSDYATVQAKATVALKRVWPDLRPIAITHPVGGRA